MACDFGCEDKDPQTDPCCDCRAGGMCCKGE